MRPISTSSRPGDGASGGRSWFGPEGCDRTPWGAVEPIAYGISVAAMAGRIVDPTVSPAHARPSAPPAQWVVLVAVAFGVLFGAMACAAGMAGGAAHSATQPSVLEVDELSMDHSGHLAPVVEPESQPTPPREHGDHSGTPPMTGNHPGMACVVSVDLHAPETSSVTISDSYHVPLTGMNTRCPADVDPPVPRFS